MYKHTWKYSKNRICTFQMSFIVNILHGHLHYLSKNNSKNPHGTEFLGLVNLKLWPTIGSSPGSMGPVRAQHTKITVLPPCGSTTHGCKHCGWVQCCSIETSVPTMKSRWSYLVRDDWEKQLAWSNPVVFCYWKSVLGMGWWKQMPCSSITLNLLPEHLRLMMDIVIRLSDMRPYIKSKYYIYIYILFTQLKRWTEL